MIDMSKNKQEFPYEHLGASLRKMRQKRQETLAEVSGAVEIEIDSLTSIEKGTTRPGEDVLLLLISYFGIKEDEAKKLWEEAGYDKRHMHPHLYGDDQPDQPQAMMVMPFDLRVVYTDMAHVMINDYGVVMNFMQTAGMNNQPLAVARVGMSREHAQSVLELLQKTLAESAPKALPAPEAQKTEGSDAQQTDKQK